MQPLVVTFTGSDLDKNELSRKLLECAASISIRVDGPLTNDTRILIAGKSGALDNELTKVTGTEKYKAAMRLSLPIIHFNWINFIHQSAISPISCRSIEFMNNNLIHELHSLSISTTGFNGSTDQSLKVLDRIKYLGGQYCASLTKSIHCLIAMDPASSSSPKILAAKKWGIPIRDINWLFDSDRECKPFSYHADPTTTAAAAARLEDVELPDQSIFAIQSSIAPPPTSSSSSSKKTANPPTKESATWLLDQMMQNNDDIPRQQQVDDHNFSNDKENNSLYLDGLSIYVGAGFTKDLLNMLRKVVREGGGNYMTEFSDIVTHFLVADAHMTAADARMVRDADVCVVTYLWLKECYASRALVDTGRFLVGGDRRGGPVSVEAVAKVDVPVRALADEAVFSGFVFTVAGFEKDENAIIANYIDDSGGKVLLLNQLTAMAAQADFEADSVFNVRPFTSMTPTAAVSSAENAPGTFVTEFFVEKCIQDKTLYPASKLSLFQPSSHTFPVAGFADVLVAVTGLSENDKQWADRIIGVLGGRMTHSMARTNTHLLYNPCGDLGSPKLEKAREWGIPCVEIEWVYRCVERGELVPVEPAATRGFSMRTTKAAKMIQKSVLKTAKLYSEKVFKGVVSAAAKVNDADESRAPPSKMAKMEEQEEMEVGNTQASEYVSLLKSTIQDTFDIISSKPGSVLASKVVGATEPLLPVKRGFIQESYANEDEETDAPKRTKTHAPNQVFYLDTDAKCAQMRLLQALEPSRPKFFMFSGILADSRPGLSRCIVGLQGHVIDLDVWDEQCTHLIISKVVKTEKFLAACASCAWILKQDYIQACKESGKWLDESQFIIGGHEHTDSAMHWKRRFIDTGKRPFSGWRCHLSIEKSRRSGFERLLAAGGASLVDSISDLSIEDGDDSQDLGYHFYDKSYSTDLDELRILYPNLKVRESSRIVDYLLSAGGNAII